jgi:succinate-semialdehyde dehydrogenase/glutarate-semialdehyde dehydrogenase
MAIMQEEVFGPVALVIPFLEGQDVVALANHSPYGLAAYVFTADLGRALDWASRLEAGNIWINRIHQAYAQTPFGGVKESGLGREKSRFGLEEFTELKTIYLNY